MVKEDKFKDWEQEQAIPYNRAVLRNNTTTKLLIHVLSSRSFQATGVGSRVFNDIS